MQMRWFYLATCAAVAWVARSGEIEPVNPNASPEARAVLRYLASVYGTASLSGASGMDTARFVYEVSGRWPAIVTFDLCGWNSPTWGPTYTPVVERTIEAAQLWWSRGGLVAMQFHWKHPQKTNGTAWVGAHGRSPPSGRYDMAGIAQPGSPARDAFLSDLDRHASYLQRLAESRVPILWRPFHEIDGGWFWWTDPQTPEHTAAAWRIMYDHLVKQRGLHNLLWVYSAGVRCGGYRDHLRAARVEGSLEDEIAFRKRYYPGDAYCDLAGIDIYPNTSEGYGDPREDTYPKAWQIMSRIAPTKMLAMCEGAAVVSPALMQQRGPAWLYTLQWWEGDPTYVRAAYHHPFLVTLDRLPTLNSNAAPVVQLRAPSDGAELVGAVDMTLDVLARPDAVKHAEFLALPGPWKNWWLMSERELDEAFSNAVVVGVCTAAPFAMRWVPPKPGLYSFTARVTDSQNRRWHSNHARVVVGWTNWARGLPVRASAEATDAVRAADGDLFTAWTARPEGSPWLEVDLGAPRAVHAVAVTWFKAYARRYRIEGFDGAQWRPLHEVRDRRVFLGNTDLVELGPVTVSRLRLVCEERGTDWGGYTVYELGAYAPVSSP